MDCVHDAVVREPGELAAGCGNKFMKLDYSHFYLI